MDSIATTVKHKLSSLIGQINYHHIMVELENINNIEKYYLVMPHIHSTLQYITIIHKQL